MQKIKILDPQEAIKIAAGEVVERPSNILKELIENSIDAGAQNITIHTKQAGKQELTITDDGCGMSPQDAQLCFAHHATSKITKVLDLQSVATYGFRGEALSSISSVANVELTTKTIEEKSATHLILEQGKLIKESTIAHPTGTTLKITDLFATIPARKKFLKSNDTEWNQIVAIFQAFCLRYPNIHFKLFHDGKLSYNCPVSTNLIQRCSQLWSNNLHDQLIEIETATKNNITITGAISQTDYHRYNRNQIFTFVNNRWVKNIEISRAIIKGYQNVLPPQKYPAVFLFIEIDPTLIDINIHPKKEEIKFLHPGIVQKFIQETVSTTLNKTISNKLQQTTPAAKLIQPEQPFILPHQQAVSSLFDDPFITTPPAIEKITTPTIQTTPAQPEQPPTSSTTFEQQETAQPTHIFKPTPQKEQEVEITNQTIHEQELFTIIGQFNTTYILIEKEQELILIDQHAAHERILYESYKKNFQDVATVQLLFPHIIKLTPEDVTTIMQHIDLFKQHGIIFEQFSDNQLIVSSTPVSMQHKAVDDIVQTTLTWIKQHDFVDHQDFFKELNEQLHAQKACKTACKAGDKLNHEQMQNIIQTLLTIENRFCCPHGRPTMWNMTLKEIEKQFKRDYKSQKPLDL